MSVTANIIVNIRVELEQVFSVCYLKKKKGDDSSRWEE